MTTNNAEPSRLEIATRLLSATLSTPDINQFYTQWVKEREAARKLSGLNYVKTVNEEWQELVATTAVTQAQALINANRSIPQ